MPMIETTTIRFAAAAAPARCRFRAEAVKNSVASSWSGEGPVAVSMIVSVPASASSETLAADHVDALGARDRDHIMPPLLEDLDEVRSDPAGGSCYGDLLASVFGLHGCSFPSAAARRRRFDLYIG